MIEVALKQGVFREHLIKNNDGRYPCFACLGNASVSIETFPKPWYSIHACEDHRREAVDKVRAYRRPDDFVLTPKPINDLLLEARAVDRRVVVRGTLVHDLADGIEKLTEENVVLHATIAELDDRIIALMPCDDCSVVPCGCLPGGYPTCGNQVV